MHIPAWVLPQAGTVKNLQEYLPIMSLNLTYTHVNKIFGEQSKNPVHALKDVSFAIEPGELFCLLGPSGCGKTTLLRSTAGLESITDGQILYGDKDMTLIPPFRRNIGMVFQSFALYPHMNIFENVAYGLRVRKTPDDIVRKKVTEVMELVGLTEELKRNPSPTGLSGGQQQRVAIARALVYDPDILLLDEPLANLDAKLRRYMRAEIRRIQKATNITTIFVTHDQEEAMAIGDRLAVLRKGVVEQIGSSNELYTRPNNAFVSNFIGKMNFFNAKLTGQGKATIEGTQTEISVHPENVRFSTNKGVANGSSVLLGARPEQLEICKERTSEGIRGTVQIIQHLGQFVRYEVVLDASVSEVSMEIDMPYMVEGVFERDSVYVKVKEGLPFLFLPEVRN
ncbi:Polyamine-transporting ATPase [Sphaerochaeta globosa str. Buddy]|uniref:Polyamine-transporting ATPase n=2 Tax=Sphaerochaeta TaxID=399320 RepID=F0RYM0_SPHGB|nr:Polyamine-transporting ATPase [Sphaerochaeta globosa str. Buddy]